MLETWGEDWLIRTPQVCIFDMNTYFLFSISLFISAYLFLRHYSKQLDMFFASCIWWWQSHLCQYSIILKTLVNCQRRDSNPSHIITNNLVVYCKFLLNALDHLVTLTRFFNHILHIWLWQILEHIQSGFEIKRIYLQWFLHGSCVRFNIDSYNAVLGMTIYRMNTF